MFNYKINGQETIFKMGKETLDRLDEQAKTTRFENDANVANASGMAGMTLIGMFLSILNVGDDKGEQREIEVNPDLFGNYLTKIAFALQNKRDFQTISKFVDNLEGDELNDFTQQVVDEIRPKASKAISIS